MIDYHEVNVADAFSNYDKLFDTVGDIDTGLKVLISDGILTTIAAQPTDAQLHDQPKKVGFQFTNTTSHSLAALAKMLLERDI